MFSAADTAARLRATISAAAGGAVGLRAVFMLGAVLALDAADKGAVSAVSGQIKTTFDISNTGVGLVLAVVSFVGAAGALPMGILTDRTRRKTILMVAIATWSGATVLSGASSTLAYLLGVRVLLGVATAAAWPCVVSLIGDFFPARERARIYGLIAAGELAGAGIGFFVSAEVSSFVGWRGALYAMGAAPLPLIWAIWRYLPEPRRGSQNLLLPRMPGRQPAQGDGAAREAVRRMHVEPRAALVLRRDPTRLSWHRTIGYLVRLPTYPLLVLASALAYFFFAGIRAFAMIYLTGHLGLSRGAVSWMMVLIGAGALAGAVGGGRLSQRLMHRGPVVARIFLPASLLALSVPLLGLGLWTASVWLALLLITAGSAAMTASIGPVDAARQDIVHPRLWGRAEAGRMVLRASFEGVAPLVFGALSGVLAGGGMRGLTWTFLAMLASLVGAAALALPASRSYLRDVATVTASIDAISGEGTGG